MTYTLTIEQTAERIARKIYNHYDYYYDNDYTELEVFESALDMLIDNDGAEMSIEEMHEYIKNTYLY